MFFRQAGIRHTSYLSDSKLFPIPVDRYAIVVLLVFAVAAPFLLDPLYVNSYILPWLIWTAAALGLNLVVGWAGQLHLGYAAVMAVGAFSGVHAAKWGVPWEIALLIAGCASALIGGMFAVAALRVKGLYLALTTLAMQIIMDWILDHVPAVVGGSHASLTPPPLRLFGLDINTEAGFYYVGLGWCILVTIFLLNLRRTSFGRALIAVREKDYAAAILGVNSLRYKILAFASSSFIAGISGTLLITTFYFVATPEQFSVEVSIQVLAMVIVGGLASIIGSYLGVALILLVPGIVNNLFAQAAENFDFHIGSETLAHIPNATYGALIIVFLMIEPLGLGKIYSNIRDYLLVWPFDQMKK